MKHSIWEFKKIGNKEWIITKHRKCFTRIGIMFHFIIWNQRFGKENTYVREYKDSENNKIMEFRTETRIFQAVINWD